MLRIENLNVSFDKPVLQAASLSVDSNSIHGIVGLNGSGKTTLLNSIAGRLKPDSGSLQFNGKALANATVAYLDTENFFYPRITAREYVSVFMLSNPSFPLEQWNELLQLPLDSLIDDFSTGMKKKTALLGMLCLQRPLFLLDEPFNGLDLQTAETLKIIMKQLQQQGTTIVVTSHILETLTSTCNAISHLHNGTMENTWQQAEFANMEQDIFKQSREEQSQLIGQLLDQSKQDLT